MKRRRLVAVPEPGEKCWACWGTGRWRWFEVFTIFPCPVCRGRGVAEIPPRGGGSS